MGGGADGQTSWWPRAAGLLRFLAMTVGASWEWEQKGVVSRNGSPPSQSSPIKGEEVMQRSVCAGMTVVWVRERWSGMLRRRGWLRARGVQPTPQHDRGALCVDC